MKCPFCKKEIDDSALKCAYCQEFVVPKSRPENKPSYTPLQFVSDMSHRLVWPLVAILIVCVFRHEISHLLGRLKSLEVAGTKTEFSDEIPSVIGAVFKQFASANTSEQRQQLTAEIEGTLKQLQETLSRKDTALALAANQMQTLQNQIKELPTPAAGTSQATKLAEIAEQAAKAETSTLLWAVVMKALKRDLAQGRQYKNALIANGFKNAVLFDETGNYQIAVLFASRDEARGALSKLTGIVSSHSPYIRDLSVKPLENVAE